MALIFAYVFMSSVALHAAQQARRSLSFFPSFFLTLQRRHSDNIACYVQEGPPLCILGDCHVDDDDDDRTARLVVDTVK